MCLWPLAALRLCRDVRRLPLPLCVSGRSFSSIMYLGIRRPDGVATAGGSLVYHVPE